MADSMVRAAGIALAMHEMDAPDLIPLGHAAASYDAPECTGEHYGDCTNHSCTCLRCWREDVDKRARAVLAAVRVQLQAVWDKAASEYPNCYDGSDFETFKCETFKLLDSALSEDGAASDQQRSGTQTLPPLTDRSIP